MIDAKNASSSANRQVLCQPTIAGWGFSGWTDSMSLLTTANTLSADLVFPSVPPCGMNWATNGRGVEGAPGLVMNESGKIGIVTVVYNSGTVLGPFLQSLAVQTYENFILYAVDSGSMDDSVAQLESWKDARLRIIRNDANIGVAAGDNQGIAAAFEDGCEYVLILNNDVEFEPETFACLVSEINALQCDMLAPKILLNDRIHLQFTGGTFEALKGYMGTHIGEGEIDRGQYDRSKQIENAPGCCLLVRSTVFGKIGMMDVKYFVYHEDADFLYRAWRAGLTMFYTPKARIFHKGSVLTGGSQSTFTIRYNARGHVYFMLKHQGVLPCLLFLPALQVRMLGKLLVRSISWREFLIRQRAFFEGVGVWASQEAVTQTIFTEKR